ncbi:hypothetical protein LINPERHAP1_LOCUS23390 [Linum perenne]
MGKVGACDGSNGMNQLGHFSGEKDPKVPRFSAFAVPTRMKRVHWEERYRQLQVSLKKLDGSDHEDYIQMLRSISSVELSRHAVELEKRSIQLSLEEGNITNMNLFQPILHFELNASSIPFLTSY